MMWRLPAPGNKAFPLEPAFISMTKFTSSMLEMLLLAMVGVREPSAAGGSNRRKGQMNITFA